MKKKPNKHQTWKQDQPFKLAIAAAFAICALASSVIARAADSPPMNRAGFEERVRPFLAKHCSDCHGEETTKAELNLLGLNPDMAVGDDTSLWNEVLDQLVARRMPPKEKPRPEAEELSAMIGWLTSELDRAARLRRSTDGRVVVRRMNRKQYNYALQDLLGVSLEFSGDLPPEAVSADGFDNNGAAVSVSSLHIENYLAIARYALDKTLVQGEMPDVAHYRFTFRRTPFVEPDGDRKVKLPATFFETTLEGKQSVPLEAVMVVDEKTQRLSEGGIYINGDRKSRGRNGSFASFSGRLGVTDEAFILSPHDDKRASAVLQMDEYPRQGKYRLRISAARQPPAGREKPGDHRPARMKILMGARTKGSSGAEVVIGDIDVHASADQPRDYIFEDYFVNRDVPLRNIEYAKHLRIVLQNPRPRPPKNKSGKREFPPDEPAYSDLVIYELEFEGPHLESWPPSQHIAIMGDGNEETNARARDIIQSFVTRAFRRPDNDEASDRFIAVYERSRKLDYPFDESVRHALTSVLCPPEFLFLVEPDVDSQNAKPRRVTAYELADRLSAFLWCSIPDEELLKDARTSALLKPDVLVSHVDRMLDDPKATRGLRDFVDQWLELAKLDNININSKKFPDRHPTLKSSMLEETRRFYEKIVLDDASCSDLVSANYSYLDEVLANHYEVPGVLGREFRKIRWPHPEQRGGILGHASVMTLSADGTRTLPILRGAWFLRTVMNDPPPPPPDIVPELDNRTKDSDKLTLKEKLARHRDDAACLDCHRKIDPWGFPFEQYDAIGRWRTTMEDSKYGQVDSTAILNDGTKLAGIAQLRRYLQGDMYDAFLKAYIEKLTAYALGRSLEYTDRDAVNQILREAKGRGTTMRGVYKAIVSSDAFQIK